MLRRPPLTDPELIRRRNEMVTANARLAYSCVRDYLRRGRATGGLDRGELDAVALEGLLRAAESFDASRGFQFSTYAVVAIQRALQRAVHGARRRVGRTVAISERRTTELPDPRAANPAAVAVQRESARLVDDLLRHLDERSRVVVLACNDGQSYRQIAAGLGVSVEWVRQIRNKALARLRDLATVRGMLP